MVDRKLTADRCPVLRWHRWVERSEETEVCEGELSNVLTLKA